MVAPSLGAEEGVKERSQRTNNSQGQHNTSTLEVSKYKAFKNKKQTYPDKYRTSCPNTLYHEIAALY
jgi:hypothetical protein